MRGEFIQLLKYKGEEGLKVRSDLHQRVVELIVDHVNTHDETTMADVIELAKLQLKSADIEYVTLQVKIDLEFRGFLLTVPSPRVPQRRLLRLTSKGYAHFSIDPDERDHNPDEAGNIDKLKKWR